MSIFIIKAFIKEIKMFFCNSWRYRKILKNDYDYDYDFLLYFIEKKLILMENYFRTGITYTEGRYIKADEIKQAINLFNIYKESSRYDSSNNLKIFFNYISENIEKWSD